MSEPINVFQSARKRSTTGNLSFLSTQVAKWQQLTKIIQAHLPGPEKWQVACYQHGVLLLTGENQAMLSQVAYLQKHYIAKLAQLTEFRELQKIQVCLRTQNAQPEMKSSNPNTMTDETQQLLRDAAHFINDPKLSQALLRLASTKNESIK